MHETVQKQQHRMEWNNEWIYKVMNGNVYKFLRPTSALKGYILVTMINHFF